MSFVIDKYHDITLKKVHYLLYKMALKKIIWLYVSGYLVKELPYFEQALVSLAK